MAKYFSVEQANRTLPLVRRIVEDIVSTHAELEGLVDIYRSLEETNAAERARRLDINEELQELTRKVNRYIGELNELGVLFKGFGEGLVDFYSMVDGRPVFLCWKLGEQALGWWHEVDAGFAGRQRLPTPTSSGATGAGL